MGYVSSCFTKIYKNNIFIWNLINIRKLSNIPDPIFTKDNKIGLNNIASTNRQSHKYHTLQSGMSPHYGMNLPCFIDISRRFRHFVNVLTINRRSHNEFISENTSDMGSESHKYLEIKKKKRGIWIQDPWCCWYILYVEKVLQYYIVLLHCSNYAFRSHLEIELVFSKCFSWFARCKQFWGWNVLRTYI